jgi:hypothetical protein
MDELEQGNVVDMTRENWERLRQEYAQNQAKGS